MSSNILVTGGAGYIGSHTCQALKKAGFQPITLDNLIYGHPWAVKWGSLEEGDIADRSFVDAILKKYQPVAVIHFAAFAYVGESVSDPLRYYRNNVASSLNLLEAMQSGGVNRIVFSSSCATYGIPDAVPIGEATRQLPVNPYGATKLMVERMLQDATNAKLLSHVSLRYFNAAGADPESGIGEDHAPETHLIPLAVAAAQDPAKTLSVFGTDYTTPDGTAIRDYVHVRDLAVAHVAALRYLLHGGRSAFCNVGTGRGVSVLEIINAVERASGRKVQWRAAPRRAGDPPSLIADVGQMQSLLGLSPSRFASLQEIVESAWRWHAAHQSAPVNA